MNNKKLLLIGLIFSQNLVAQVGINTSNPQGIFNIDGKKNNESTGVPSKINQSDDFVILNDGSVGVGTTSPDPSSILELNISELTNGNKKGFLAPRLSLSSYNDKTTITNPAEGLLVYNIGSIATFPYKGYVFWNGLEWRTLNDSSLVPGNIDSFVCNDTSLLPNNYTTGVLYSGTMTVPYINGNGGVYSDQTIGPINGLTAKLESGNLEIGAGKLTYSVSGTPTITSPVTTTFHLSLNGIACDAIVGAGDDVKAGELVYYKSNDIPANIGSGGADGVTTINWLSSNVNESSPLPVIGGKLRIDGYFTAAANSGPGLVSFNPRLVNVSSSPVKFWFAALTNVDRFNGANIVLSATGSNSGAPGGGGWINLDNGIYSNYGSNGLISKPNNSITGLGNTSQEVLTMDVDLDNKWYRVYYFINVDNKNTLEVTDDIRRLYISIQRLY